MQSKRIVISGGPSSGKTTIINALEKDGFYCFEEISRELIKASQKKGIEQPFLENPEQFNKDLLNARILQFKKANDLKTTVFYDRGVHDVVAYMRYGKHKISNMFIEGCNKSKYNQVFLLPPWQKIHVTDNERYESYEQANEIYKCIHNAYISFGYNVTEVPIGTIAERKSFILKNIV